MTLLQLIVEVVNYTKQDDTVMNEANMQSFLKSENYRAILNNSLREINRAIQDILPYVKHEIQTFSVPVDKSVRTISIKLDTFDPKIYRVFRTYYTTNDGKAIIQTPNLIAGKQLSARIHNAKEFFVEYYPRIPVFTEADLNGSTYSEDEDSALDMSIDLTKYGLTDYICISVIPHLAKSKLWQELEPELAQLERNEGLQNLMNYDDGNLNESPQYQVDITNDWSGE